MIKMNWKKIAVPILLIVCVGGIGYWLEYLPLGLSPPGDPNVDRIAFTAASSPGLSTLFINYDVYVMNLDKPGLTHVTWQSGIEVMPAWSPQGDKIAYYGSEGLYITGADGSDRPQLLRRGATLDPAWSPDGSKIAFAEYSSLYVLEIESREVSQITDGSISSDSPTWSPDGSQIVFVIRPHVRTPGGGPEGAIAIINADGSGFVQLTELEDGSSGSPDWSSDGDWIAFVREGDIYVMRVDGTNVKALTHDGENRSPTWSPDGTRIAFVSFKNARCGITLSDAPAFCTSELYVMNADGSNVTLVRSKKNEKIVYPDWAP
jgi:TolB protein